ncbi:MAG: methyltransferase domain-containing protein [Myxococcota bacterium]
MYRYDWIARPEQVGDQTFDLVALRDFEAAVTELLDHVLAGGDRAWFEDRCPMFGVVWPSARALAARLAAEELAGLRLLELGCGLGLPSLVAARRGAHVVATDQHPDAAERLADNARRNGVALRFCAFDWRGEIPPDVPERGFDRVVASDVLYAPDQPAAVAAAFDRFLAPSGRGLLADPGRPWLQAFADAARDRGLRVEVDVALDAFVLEVRRG